MKKQPSDYYIVLSLPSQVMMWRPLSHPYHIDLEKQHGDYHIIPFTTIMKKQINDPYIILLTTYVYLPKIKDDNDSLHGSTIIE